MYSYDPVGFILKVQPEFNEIGEQISPGEFFTGEDGNPIFHVNSRPGQYPEEAEPYRLDPKPKNPIQLWAGVPIEDTEFFAFPNRELAEEIFEVNQEEPPIE